MLGCRCELCCGGRVAKWKVDFEANLPADPWACNVASAQEGEGDGHTAVELVPASGKALELVLAQAALVRDRAVSFRAEGNARVDVVGQGEASGVDMAASILSAQNAGAGIACEEESKIGIEPSLVADRLLRDGVEPVISEAGTELLAPVGNSM